ncbi:minor tail protein [Mycobacterium phage Rahalelujah]|nr:minor tail protein [Mycobacterium phage Rahalelujah]
MTGLFNPDSGWEVFLLCFVSFMGMVGIVAPVWLQQKRQGNKLNEIRDHVSNDHSTNLRDDIDELMSEVRRAIQQVADVKVDVRDVRQDIGGIREDIRLERQERIAGDRIRIEAQALNINPQ